MKYKLLGGTGVYVSTLCLGTMTFGGDSDRETSHAVFNKCREAGINFFDCANTYMGGLSEEILGECIGPCRQEVIITSKAFFPTSEDINATGAHRKGLMAALEASLRRLKTDYVDVYFIHRFDGLTPLEETLRVLDDMVRQGKILYPAASNFAAWQVEKALGISARQGWSRFECLQPMYNLVKRQAEAEILPMAQAESLGVIPYSPAAGGLLSGKYKPGWQAEGGRLTTHKIYQTRYGEEWVYPAVTRFTEFAGELGVHPITLAVAWVGSHPAVTAPIIGARNLDQLAASLAAADFAMTPELREQVSALTPEPPPATDRSEERTDYHFNMR